MSIPRTVSVALAILIPRLYEVEQFVEMFIAAAYHVTEGALDLPFLHRVTDPAVELGLHDLTVYGYHQVLRHAEVDECPLRAGVGPCGVRRAGPARADLLGQRDQTLQVRLVVERFLLPLLDQVIEQFGHAVVVPRVHRVVVDDDLADVVGDGLGNGIRV